MHTIRDIVIMSTDNNPIKQQLMEAIHTSAYTNQLGYLDGMDPDTGQIVPLLVGVDRDKDGGMSFYPIAQLFLSTSELKRYLTPDMHGSWVDNSIKDANGEDIASDFDQE